MKIEFKSNLKIINYTFWHKDRLCCDEYMHRIFYHRIIGNVLHRLTLFQRINPYGMNIF